MQLLSKFVERLQRSRRKLASAGIALLAAWLAIHALFGANGMMVYRQKRAEYRSVQTEINLLQGENERLSQQIKALKSDPGSIEREAREQLRYAKPGEVVYVLPAPKASAKPANITAEKQ